MRNLTITILIACVMVLGLTIPAQAQMASKAEALTVAQNWVNLIIELKGDWGGSETAMVQEIQEFKRGQRVIGYFCHVKPKGHIVISLRKELAPVKAYSATCDLDPESYGSNVIKVGMERVLEAIEERLGPIESVSSQNLQNILGIDYRSAWAELSGNVKDFKAGLESGAIEVNYQEGQVLLSSNWHQGPPYNNDCPNMGCSWGGCCGVPSPPYGCNNNAVVGCVATAGAQIMRYWAWPPYGVGSPYNDTYDWRNMPDVFTGCTWPAAQVNAVAELCREVGIAVGMSYGCSGSSASTYDMEGVYEGHYRYSDWCLKRDRDDYPADGIAWFNGMKDQFNWNRPVQYKIPGHSIVADGWQEIGSTPTRQYHLNWGHGDGKTTWYTLDAIPGSNIDEEYRLENILPAQFLGYSLSGTYSRDASFPYRYFNIDATGSATFEAGQNLQFLPRITVTGGNIRFVGTSSYNTRLFTRGDTSGGVRIYNGGIRLYQNGGIKFH